MNLNKVLLIGRLTADPELRSTSSGNPVASFSVATNRVWTNKTGERQEATEFHNVVVWGRQAETTHQFLKKGALVLIEGRLQTRSWEGRDGQSKRTTEVIAERVQFGPRAGGSATSFGEQKPSTDAHSKEKDSQIPEISLNAEGEEIKGEDIFGE